MQLAMISFTKTGANLSLRLSQIMKQHTCTLLTTEKLANETIASYGNDLSAWTSKAFAQYNGIIFIGACGIAVRTIAPYLKSKATDPAVVVVDETGQFAISLVSGHIGCANELAQQIANAIGATPVITTATDMNGLFAIDSWASRHGLHMSDLSIAKEISARLLHKEPVGMTADWFVLPQLPQGFTADHAPVGALISIYEDDYPYALTLRLIPKLVTIGIGCKRGTSANTIESFVQSCLKQESISFHSIRQVCTVNLKQDEPGLLEFCNRHKLPIHFYSPDELDTAKGHFSTSAFVQQTIGIDNVCERACVLGSNQGALIVPKSAQNGVTFAAALQDWRVTFEY